MILNGFSVYFVWKQMADCLFFQKRQFGSGHLQKKLIHMESTSFMETFTFQEDPFDLQVMDLFFRDFQYISVQYDKICLFTRRQAAVKIIIAGASGSPQRVGFKRFQRRERLRRIGMIASDMHPLNGTRDRTWPIASGSDQKPCIHHGTQWKDLVCPVAKNGMQIASRFLRPLKEGWRDNLNLIHNFGYRDE